MTAGGAWPVVRLYCGPAGATQQTHVRHTDNVRELLVSAVRGGEAGVGRDTALPG